MEKFSHIFGSIHKHFVYYLFSLIYGSFLGFILAVMYMILSPSSVSYAVFPFLVLMFALGIIFAFLPYVVCIILIKFLKLKHVVFYMLLGAITAFVSTYLLWKNSNDFLMIAMVMVMGVFAGWKYHYFEYKSDFLDKI